jgi:hypothetical protein
MVVVIAARSAQTVDAGSSKDFAERNVSTDMDFGWVESTTA